MTGEAHNGPIESSAPNASKSSDGNAVTGQPAMLKSTSRGRFARGSDGGGRTSSAARSVDVVLERRVRGYAVLVGEVMKRAGDDGDSFYRAILLGLGQTRGDEVASHDIQTLRNDVADTLLPRLNSGLLRLWWQNRKKRTGLSPERYVERYIRSPGSWDDALSQMLPVIVPSCATWRRLGGKRLLVDMPAAGQEKPVKASDLWRAFVNGDATRLAPMAAKVLRDKPLPVSVLTRAAHVTLEHPGDAVEMRAVPPELSVVFAALASTEAGRDRRNLILLPGSTTLVDAQGSLPSIEVALSSDGRAGTRTYVVTDTGSGGIARFIFATGVACPAMQVLETLKTAADLKKVTFKMAVQDLASSFPASAMAPGGRAAMARLWSDLSDDIRRRVLVSFGRQQNQRKPAAAALDVVHELKSGSDTERVTLASNMLAAALELWPVRRRIGEIPFSFWQAAMAHELPADVDRHRFSQASSRVHERFKRDVPPDHDLADDVTSSAPSTPIAVSALWLQLVADTKLDQLRLDPHALRDAAIDLSLMNRRATLVLDHSGDLLKMSSIARDLTVRFEAAAPGAAGSDQRWLVIEPGMAEFLGEFGMLPSIDVSLADGDRPGSTIYTVFDCGRRIGCRFIFNGAVAQRVRDVLLSLKRAADAKWSTFRALQAELTAAVQPGQWSQSRRLAAAACWQAFPEPIRKRVCDYYRQDPRHADLLVAMNVQQVLTDGGGAAGLVLARQLLISAMDYWDQFGEAGDIAESFWADAIRRPASTQLSPADFREAFDVVLQANRQWQEWAPLFDRLLAWLIQPVLESHAQYRQLRQCLLRATTRAVGIALAPPALDDGAPDSLSGSTAADVRTRLVRFGLALAADATDAADGADGIDGTDGTDAGNAAGVTPARMVARLLPWMAQLGGAAAIVLDADDRLGDALIAEQCVPAGMGVHAVCYRLDPALPPDQVAAVFDIASSLLADGGMALEKLGQSDDAIAEGRYWWRDFRFSGGWKFDPVARTWGRAQHQMTVTGTTVAQRDAFDTHLGRVLRDMASMQSLYLWSNDQELLEVPAGAAMILPSHSRFEQRHVRFAGAAGLLQLLPDLHGTITLDLSQPGSATASATASEAGLQATSQPDHETSDARLDIAPALLRTLRKSGQVERGKQTFTRYHSGDNGPVTLLIGPMAGDHPLLRALDAQIQQAAYRAMLVELADETKPVVELGTVLDEELILPPIGRDVLLKACGATQHLVVRTIGTGRAVILSVVPPGASHADWRMQLELELPPLPRYGVSDMVMLRSGYRTAAVFDRDSGGGSILIVCSSDVRPDRGAWGRGQDAVDAVQEVYIDHLFDWDARLLQGQEFNADDMDKVDRYADALARQASPSMLQRAAILSAEVESAHQAALAGSTVGGEGEPGHRKRVSTVMAQMLVFSFSSAFDNVSLPEWRKMVSERGEWRSMCGCLIDMYIDTAWVRQAGDEFYSGLAGFYAFQRMMTFDAQHEAALLRDERCIDAALDLIAGLPVDDQLLREVGLAHVQGHSVRMLQLKLVLITHLDDRLFDDDPLWRNDLLRILRQEGDRTPRSSTLDLLASLMGRGGWRERAQFVNQSEKEVPSPVVPPRDVVIFDQVSMMPRISLDRSHLAVGSGIDDGTESAEQLVCRVGAAFNFAGALLIFIGDLGTVMSKWYINEPRDPKQRLTTMYFQIVKASGWAMQSSTGFACHPDTSGVAKFVQVTAPVVGIGMGLNYLAGALGELVRPPQTRWTWRNDERPLAARLPSSAVTQKIMQVIDLMGNVYMLLAESSHIATLNAQLNRPGGSDILSATITCGSSGLGIVTAGGEIGSKSLLTPARQFYQMVGMSSAILNLGG